MIKSIKEHWGYYLLFTIMQIIGFALVASFVGQRELLYAAILMTTVTYFIFGIAHHLINHDLNNKIMIEYALVGSLGLALAIFLFSV